MGASSSRSNICPHCAISVKLPTDEDNNTTQSTSESIFCCSRCNGGIKLNSPRQMEFHRHPQPIQYLHIAPFASNALSHELKMPDQKYDIDLDLDDAEMDEEMRKAIKMSMEQDFDRILIDEYLKPFFNQHSKLSIQSNTRLVIKNIEFKIFACYPPYGYVTNATDFILNDAEDKLMQLQSRPIHRIHILPTKASLETYCKKSKINMDAAMKDLFTTHIQTYLQGTDETFYIGNSNTFTDRAKNRYLMQGETFLFKNVEFRVMTCQPLDGFIDLKLTKVFCDGNALNDIKSINIRPICDGLPVNHKDYSSQQIADYYLKKYFYGRSKYIDGKENDIINIKEVSFMINMHECVPLNGIVTCATEIRNASPIRHWELLQIQQEKDEEYAQQIQQNELRESRMHVARLYGNSNEPFLQFIRLLEQFNGMRMEEKENEANRGINERLINTLPTFKYTETKNAEDGNKSCRICLEDYKVNDELRSLPCFHSFHQECVDQWLQINDKCPICKTSVLNNTNR